jgi:hypothetical protein
MLLFTTIEMVINNGSKLPSKTILELLLILGSINSDS